MTSTGTMQRAAAVLRILRYGWADEGLAVRLEADARLSWHRIVVQLGAPGGPDASLPFGIPLLGDVQTYALVVWHDTTVHCWRRDDGGWREWQPAPVAVRRDGVLECLLPKALVQPPQGDRCELRVVLQRDEQTVEMLPVAGTVALVLQRPTEEEGEGC